MLENCETSSRFSHFSRRFVNSSIGATNSGRSKLPRATKIVPGKVSRLLVNRRAPQSGQKLRRFSDIVERLRLAAEEREIIFWHTKESRRRATGGLFAVVARAGRDKCRIRIELKLDCTTGALCRVFLAHAIHLVWAAYLVSRTSIRTLAVGPDEAGFWPMIGNPSVTTWTP